MPSYANQGPGTGYTNWDTIFGLNRAGAQRMTNSITDPINAEAANYQQGMGALQQAAAGGDLQQANTDTYAKLGQQAADIGHRAALASGAGGAAAYLGQGKTAGYSPGENAYDAALAGSGTGANQLQAVGQYANMPSIFAGTKAAPAAPMAPGDVASPEERRRERRDMNTYAARANARYGME